MECKGDAIVVVNQPSNVMEEALIEEVCLSDVEICEQLVRMAHESGYSHVQPPTASSTVVNMPPITPGTRVQLIAQPMISHPSDTQEFYVMQADGTETVIQLPSSILYSDATTIIKVPENEALETACELAEPTKSSLTDLLHSYAAKATEKETDGGRLSAETAKQKPAGIVDEKAVGYENDVPQSSVQRDDETVISAGLQRGTSETTQPEVVHTTVGHTDSESTNAKGDCSLGTDSHPEVTVTISAMGGERLDVNDGVMSIPELSNEPVRIQKKIPYAVLSGNTLTLLQKGDSKNSLPLLAKTTGHEQLTSKKMAKAIPLISKHRLRRRIVTEPGQMPYVCDICDKGFNHSYNLKLHLRAHIDDRPHICSICNKGFLQATKLKNHMTTHTKEKRYQCGVCKKMFGYQESLKKHARVHSGEKTFTCKVCSKTFAWLNVLNSHMMTHSDNKRFVCDVCGKCFSYHTSLKSHMRRHSASDAYHSLRCEICEHDFLYESTLQRHIASHANDTLHQCQWCEKKYSSVTILERHLRIHDPHTKQFLCDSCMLSFPDLSQLHEHVKNHAVDRKHVCDICGKGFVHVRGLRQHTKLHTPVMTSFCSVCDKGFMHRGNLTMHMRTHTGERPYTCGQCEKSFTGSSSLKRHERIHSGKLPYLCMICAKRFVDIARLNKHHRTAHPGDNQLVVMYEIQEVS